MTKLTFGTLPQTHWQTLSPVLKAIGWVPDEHSNPEQWLKHANTSQTSLALLAYSHPNIQLAEALREGVSPSQALNQWLEQASTLLIHVRQHRQTTILINLEQALANPNALLEHARERFDLNTNEDQAAIVSIEPEKQEPDTTDLLAFYLLSTSSAAQELLDRLEASTTPLTDESLAERTPSLNADILYQQYQDINQAANKHFELKPRFQELEQRYTELEKRNKQLDREQHSLAQQKNELDEENGLVIEQLHKVQKELEGMYLEREEHTARQNQVETTLKQSKADLSASQQKLKQANNSQSKLNTELAATIAKNKELVDENRLILDQLFKVQEELEQQYLNNQELTELEKINKQLDREQHSLAQQKNELDEENSLVVEQLHKVQEELEGLYLEREEHTAGQNQVEATLKQSKVDMSTSQQKLKQANSSQSKLNTELAATIAKNKELEDENRQILDQLFKVQEELEQQYLNNKELTGIQEHARQLQQQLDKANAKLERLTHSVSWRVTAPARALGKPFRKASPETRSIKSQIEVIRKAKALDAKWYSKTYPDVVENGTDPIEHYVRFGATEDRNPSPDFNTAWYKASYPDVEAAGLNPLVHYIKFGREEGRQPRP